MTAADIQKCPFCTEGVSYRPNLHSAPIEAYTAPSGPTPSSNACMHHINVSEQEA